MAKTVDWLETDFFKAEMELGHCLCVPEEDPCQRDLYLWWPVSRRRRPILVASGTAERPNCHWVNEDAQERGWPREMERHCAIADRISDLLARLESELATRCKNRRTGGKQQEKVILAQCILRSIPDRKEGSHFICMMTLQFVVQRILKRSKVLGTNVVETPPLR